MVFSAIVFRTPSLRRRSCGRRFDADDNADADDVLIDCGDALKFPAELPEIDEFFVDLERADFDEDPLRFFAFPPLGVFAESVVVVDSSVVVVDADEPPNDLRRVVFDDFFDIVVFVGAAD